MFARVGQYGVFGLGHCYFFRSPDGTQDWIAYHARSEVTDTYADRSTRVQRFTWAADGTPQFGLPHPLVGREEMAARILNSVSVTLLGQPLYRLLRSLAGQPDAVGQEMAQRLYQALQEDAEGKDPTLERGA